MDRIIVDFEHDIIDEDVLDHSICITYNHNNNKCNLDDCICKHNGNDQHCWG